MRISNKHLRLTLIGASGLLSPLNADELTLSGDDARLTGTLLSINESGVVELASPLSPSPLLLRNGAVEKVDFSAAPAPADPPGALIALTNGDLLPANILAMDEAKLTVHSPQAGPLEIPRAALSSIQLGIRGRKVIYAGPRNSDEWAESGGPDASNWSYEDGSLTADGAASVSRKFDLPRRFTLRFTLRWQGTPNFQIYFADPLQARGVACDRYFLRFSAAGLDIKREAAQGKRYNDILLLNRTPNQYPDRVLNVELRVDRAVSRIQLFLNGEPEGVFADPIRPIPDGSGITLASTAPEGNSQEIHDIEILELNDSSARHRAEERGDLKTDSLISREEDRWGGRLLDIRNSGGTLLFRFKSNFQDEPLELPAADVSTVFFATGDAPDPAKANGHPFLLRLQGEGSLRVTSCGFSADAVSAVHPLLGRLTLRRDGVTTLQRHTPKAKPEP
jgi:hypothetical protein